MLATLLLSPCLGAFGQAAAPATGAAPPATGATGAMAEETVTLPQFVITENPANPYQSQQALSAARTAMSTMDIPQTLSVVTKEMIADSESNRMLDAAKFVTPVVESTLPYGADRYMIRGFLVSEEFIDGTNISGPDGYSMSLPTYNIDRIEVIKGPNAILVPGGSPGGVMNPITKSPLFSDFGSVEVGASQYLGDDASFDVNRVLDSKRDMAFRMVGAYWNTDYYIQNQFRRGYEFSPAWSYQLTPTNRLTIKADWIQNRETNLGGVPIDPTVGSSLLGGTQYATIARVLPRDWMFGNDIDSRHRRTQRASAELLFAPADHVSSRLYIMVDHVHRRDVGGTSAGLTGGGGGSVNPFTGLYEPGVTWNTSAYNANGSVALVGTASPITNPSTWVFTRNNGLVDLDYLEGHIKDDYAAKYETPWFNSTTLVGFASNMSRVHYISYTPAARPSVPANALSTITFPAYNFAAILPGLTTANLGTNRTGRDIDAQGFVYETLSFLNDRVIVSGGVSRFFGSLARTDNTGTAILAALPNSPAYNLTSDATSVGLVVKPIKEVSVFASRNTSGGTMPGSINAGVTDPTTKVAVGFQDEFGVKTSFFDGRLTASLAHFQIAQANYPVTNSQYYYLVSLGDLAGAAALPQALYVNLKSVGWEFESTYAVTKGLTVLINFSDDPVRIPITNVRPRGVPDHSSAFYADYEFSTGVLKHFGVNAGVDYKGDVAGENATGYTSTRSLPGSVPFVPVQPSFFVKNRTLTNLGITYKEKTWSIGVTCVNLANVDYILAAGSRSSLVVGTPRTWKSSFEYRF